MSTRHRLLACLKGKASAANQRSVVIWPVADPILEDEVAPVHPAILAGMSENATYPTTPHGPTRLAGWGFWQAHSICAAVAQTNFAKNEYL